MKNYKERINLVKKLIEDAEYVLVGAGSGLSTAAGLEYSGDKFKKDYEEYIEKYHFKDLYSASFYEFETQEEKWAFFAKLIELNRYNEKPLKLYLELMQLIKEKEYFILSTNVDGQFEKAGFDKDRIFEIQGDYAYLQCEQACHDKLYYNEKLVKEWLKGTKDFKIPKSLIPVCPVCGEDMELNLRKDSNFVQDTNWYKQEKRYKDFLKNSLKEKVLLLEIGVGFNTPGIIRYPFERIVYTNDNSNLIRINKEHAFCSEQIKNRTVLFDEDINEIIKDINEEDKNDN